VGQTAAGGTGAVAAGSEAGEGTAAGTDAAEAALRKNK